MNRRTISLFSMAGLDPATRPASVRERDDSIARADAQTLRDALACLVRPETVAA